MRGNRRWATVFAVGVCLLMLVPSVSRAQTETGDGGAGLNPNTHNLALGRPYSVKATRYNGTDASYEQQYPDTDNRELTDGQMATGDFYDARYVGWANQGDRIIEFDLGFSAKIDTVRMHFLQDKSAAIFIPGALKVELRRDENSFMTAATVHLNASASEDTQWATAHLSDKWARYVRITVPAEYWVFSDELEVIGSPAEQLLVLICSNCVGYVYPAAAGHIAAVVIKPDGEGIYYSFAPKQADSALGNVPGKLTVMSVPNAARIGVGKILAYVNETRAAGSDYDMPFPQLLNPGVSAELLEYANDIQAQTSEGTLKYNLAHFNCLDFVKGLVQRTGIYQPSTQFIPNDYVALYYQLVAFEQSQRDKK